MILIYLFKVSACTLMFFALYQLLLAKLSFFKLNRIYLLLMLVLSFIIPALTVESESEAVAISQKVFSKVIYSTEPSTEKDFVDGAGSINTSFNWSETIEYTYFFIGALFILKWLFSFLYIKNQLRKNVMNREGAVLFVDANSAIKNCSFFNTIIIDSALLPDEQVLVIKHELVHVKQWHALDKLFVNMATALLWFNPIMYFWRNAIDHNHEFLADSEISKIADKNTYASLLLNLATPTRNFSINSFSKLPLKNRIMMMYKEPNSKLQKLVYFLVVPMILVCSVAFINRKVVVVNKTTSADMEFKSPMSKILANSYFSADTNLNPNNKTAFNGVEMILVVDAGHGGKDDAVKALDGQLEKDLNLRAVKILKEEAAKRGIKVLLTRTDDQFLTLHDRLPKQKATAFISIHHNATLDENLPAKGIEVYVSKLNPNIKGAENLGIGILDKLNGLNGIEVKDKLKDANLYLLRESKIPAVLIELGNISDESNLKYINNEKNIRKISNLILDGFVSFVKTGC